MTVGNEQLERFCIAMGMQSNIKKKQEERRDQNVQLAQVKISEVLRCEIISLLTNFIRWVFVNETKSATLLVFV